ncbi:lipopolysaccharide biosynthesis protein [Komarekiella sp. 'clone 1']|uniref:Lipopolysaccharide biosynthesis protein n=1 Tax=Komarekiella delphini-convector SJRDD-AB1 TaxID=2593771 RepID=A0AA40VSJ7_9NOST|nr:lipopolysaccharide biosynthesis protein [Komarekiella delphini-convector]MBD6618239.1 lipopolysaccharide biosynthesis protein [Komarekiella delphini-convector SJRDD-AB1]
MQYEKVLTLRHNLSWAFIGNAVYAACQWGMLVVLAKFGNPKMVGQFALGLAVAAPIIMLTNLQLRSVQATDNRKQYSFSDYLGLRLISIALALVIITVVSLLGGYESETSLVIFLVGLAKALESISDVFYGLQQNKGTNCIAVSLIIKGFLSLLLLSIGVYQSGNILWGVTGLVFAGAVVLVGYDIHNGVLILKHLSKLQPRWHQPILLKLVWLCLPLGFVMMLVSLNHNIPRYFIEQYLGVEQLGIFAAIAYLMVIGGMLVNLLGESASPQLAKYYAAGDAIAFRTLLLKLVGMAALLGVTGVLVALVDGRQILTVLYQPEYGEQANLFVWLMVAAGIGYVSSSLGYGMAAAKYFCIQILLFAVVTIILPIACIWLLPQMKLLGAAIALIIAATVQVVMSLGVILHSLHKLATKNLNPSTKLT